MQAEIDARLSDGATVADIAPLIGHTPMLRIEYICEGRPRRLYARYEQENMTGSIKDRMAEHILRRAYESGELRPGDTIVEASSGNTGISFAAIGRALTLPIRPNGARQAHSTVTLFARFRGLSTSHPRSTAM